MQLKNKLIKQIESEDNPELLRELYSWFTNRKINSKADSSVQEPAENYTSMRKKMILHITTEHQMDKLIELANDLNIDVADSENLVNVLADLKPTSIAPLEKLAKQGGIQSVSDPVLWQREQRQDRTLHT